MCDKKNNSNKIRVVLSTLTVVIIINSNESNEESSYSKGCFLDNL